MQKVRSMRGKAKRIIGVPFRYGYQIVLVIYFSNLISSTWFSADVKVTDALDAKETATMTAVGSGIQNRTNCLNGIFEPQPLSWKCIKVVAVVELRFRSPVAGGGFSFILA